MDFPKTFDLDGKVVVITGGAGDLPSTMAKAIANCGGNLAILDINEESMSNLTESLDQENIDYLTKKVDVTDKNSLYEAKKEILEKFGSIDVLINGVGGNRPEATTNEDKSFFELSEEGIKSTLHSNFLGTFFPCQVFGEVMAEQGEGVILNISSMNAFTPLTRIPAYSAAKAAVSNFTQWLATHMSHNYSSNIRVNAIAPGFFLTEQTQYLHKNQETGNWTDRAQSIINNTPMDRFGKPEDLITAVLWLISPGSEFVHGAIIPIDGGFSSYSGV